MNLNALTELESWLKFPIDYADGVAILSQLKTSGSYSDYVKRVAEASLKTPEEINSAVDLYLTTHPRHQRATSESAPASFAEQLVVPQLGMLRTRCIYCNHQGLYQRKTSRMTSRGWGVFAVLMLLFFPLAIIPLLFMRELHYSDYCNRCNRMQDID